eukprot:TRINITY_DN75683_c0_g1_i1.p1 TRINITY_DN75683_c0_g1~~TRINITY_DN75683_c0_g1_i1.p1  ORF type:complete len:321 (-),score=74.55 TRINITY_DN75683_c0_g1_i1:397-1359(-)
MAPATKGIDYSKFDKIEDSDDEKPQATAKATAKDAEVTPHCHNCHKDITKPLRCGVCKKAAYCSATCQKDDWRFHKRSCQPPAQPKAKNSPKKPAPSTVSDAERKSKKEEKIVEDDENLTWYRHREWKPSDEPKREFKPEVISDAPSATPADDDANKPTAGSVWNKAGTWEDKDVTATAKSTLQEKLSNFPPLDAAGGSIVIDKIDNLEGDASKPVIRGKLRHLFDFSFKVHFTFRWMDASGQRNSSGVVAVSDFTNDSFSGGGAESRLDFSQGRALDAGRRQGVEDSVGAGVWQPPPHSMMASVASRMEAWAKEYESGS